MLTGEQKSEVGGLADRAVNVVLADAPNVLTGVARLPRNVDLAHAALVDSLTDGVCQLGALPVEGCFGSAVRPQSVAQPVIGHKQSFADVHVAYQGWPPSRVVAPTIVGHVA